MIRFLAAVVTMTLFLSACTAYKMGDALSAPGQARQGQSGPVVIGIKSTPERNWPVYVKQNKDLVQAAGQVFSQYGWKVTDRDDADIVIDLTPKYDQYVYPGFVLLYFATIGVLPMKQEDYFTINAQVSINGIQQETMTYTGNLTSYMNCYGPSALLIPDMTHRGFMEMSPPDELWAQTYKRTLQHIAEDIRAKYLSGNYQRAQI